MHKMFYLKISILLVLCTVLFILIGNSNSDDQLPDWRKGELVVILPLAESIDYQFNRQLAESFASFLGVRLKILEMNPYQVSTTLTEHLAHFSAIGMRSNEDNALLRFGPPYQAVNEALICKNMQPQKLEDVIGRSIVVIKDSAEDAALLALHLKWQTVMDGLPSDLLEQVNRGERDCTVANEEQITIMRNFHPEMGEALNIGSTSQLAWTFAIDSDPELYAQMEKFFIRIEEDGTLELFLDRFYGHTERIIALDAAAFIAKANTVLPRYRPMFEEAAALSGIDWHLLAAMSYRESHWNPLATSYTNVRGMMMLTEDTADRMNVKNRLDAHISIMAGARYLQLLKEQLPLRINEPERTWLALAAYNKGLGHLEDARVLAQRLKLNPDLWVDVQKALVKLRDPKIAKTLKHGYARGGEAVVYVETVRLYYDMLKRITKDEYTNLLPADYQIRLNAW
jgi:membrane-bound lytic murein transglycosylase F